MFRSVNTESRARLYARPDKQTQTDSKHSRNIRSLNSFPPLRAKFRFNFPLSRNVWVTTNFHVQTYRRSGDKSPDILNFSSRWCELSIHDRGPWTDGKETVVLTGFDVDAYSRQFWESKSYCPNCKHSLY